MTSKPQATKISCTQVTVPVQLAKVGKYTFIYETKNSNEMSTPTQTSGMWAHPALVDTSSRAIMSPARRHQCHDESAGASPRSSRPEPLS